MTLRTSNHAAKSPSAQLKKAYTTKANKSTRKKADISETEQHTVVLRSSHQSDDSNDTVNEQINKKESAAARLFAWCWIQTIRSIVFATNSLLPLLFYSHTDTHSLSPIETTNGTSENIDLPRCRKGDAMKKNMVTNETDKQNEEEVAGTSRTKDR